MITEEAFQLWRSDPVTQIIMDQIKIRIANETAILAKTAGKDPPMDCMRVGRIQGLNDLLEVQYDD